MGRSAVLPGSCFEGAEKRSQSRNFFVRQALRDGLHDRVGFGLALVGHHDGNKRLCVPSRDGRNGVRWSCSLVTGSALRRKIPAEFTIFCTRDTCCGAQKCDGGEHQNKCESCSRHLDLSTGQVTQRAAERAFHHVGQAEPDTAPYGRNDDRGRKGEQRSCGQSLADRAAACIDTAGSH